MFCVLLRLRTPLPTLFPYTTLFRSIDEQIDVARAARIVREWLSAPIAIRERSDRKSTRLNSSHRTISYAVFCLKKKINTPNHYPAGCSTQLVAAQRTT